MKLYNKELGTVCTAQTYFYAIKLIIFIILGILEHKILVKIIIHCYNCLLYINYPLNQLNGNVVFQKTMIKNMLDKALIIAGTSKGS